jgi:hypothetical protein
MACATQRRRQEGQALVESCLAVMLICLVFTAVLQVAHVFVAREILGHAAASAARAKAVGFNNWMVTKVARAASIPNAGKLLEPVLDYGDPFLEAAVSSLKPGRLWDWSLTAARSTMQAGIELARIPEYLEAPNSMDAAMALDYENWSGEHAIVTRVDSGVMSGSDGSGYTPMIHAVVSQAYPLTIPLHRAFYDADSIDLAGDVTLENHYLLYLDDQGW